MKEPFRYRGNIWSAANPEKCAASVGRGRAGVGQCQKKRKEGSEWCHIHDPAEAPEDAPRLWVVDDWNKLQPKLISCAIVRETKKQIQIEDGRSKLPFRCRSKIGILKTGKPEIGARSPVDAAGNYLKECEREVEATERHLKVLRERAQAARDLMDRVWEEHHQED